MMPSAGGDGILRSTTLQSIVVAGAFASSDFVSQISNSIKLIEVEEEVKK